MTEEINTLVERHDRDLARGIVPEGTRMHVTRTADAIQAFGGVLN
jgi:hypothetical protein